MSGKLLVVALVTLALGCSSAGGSSVPPKGSGGTSGSGGTDGAGGEGAGGGSGGGIQVDGGLTDPPVAEVFGHSNSTLYRMDPKTLAVSVVGDFDCVDTFGQLGGMWDIAVDRSGNMVGTTQSSLVQIDKATAKCQVIADGGYPNSLTFVPQGTLDPSIEVLVGFTVDSYVRIDPKTGQTSKVGSLNPNPTGTDWKSSGDVVSIIGSKTYLTVIPLDGFGSSDTLVEIDPSTGQALSVVGNTGFSDLWGLAYWGGVAYGFSESGDLLSIDLSTGKGTKIPLTGVPGGLSFWGAGVTTAASIDPVN
jgi:hypothetical protein